MKIVKQWLLIQILKSINQFFKHTQNTLILSLDGCSNFHCKIQQKISILGLAIENGNFTLNVSAYICVFVPVIRKFLDLIENY